jgi:cytochrome c oxidase subunit 1
VVTGLSVENRELVVTSVTEANPDLRFSSPEPSIWPFLAALAVAAAFLGSIFTPWAVVWGSIPVGIALTAWFWPKGAGEDEK